MRNARTYSLFTKDEGGRYTRLSGLAFRKPIAVRHFQNALLAGSFMGCAMSLRPAPVETNPVLSFEYRANFQRIFGGQ